MLTLLMSMVCIQASAHDIEAVNNDGVTIYYVWTNNNTELEVSFKGDSWRSYAYTGIVAIPESVTYNGTSFPVTSIGNNAFKYNSVTSVTIPNTVTTIDEGAFLGCRSLTSVNIPNSVTAIGKKVFSGCQRLTNINIPNSVTTIGESIFYMPAEEQQ